MTDDLVKRLRSMEVFLMDSGISPVAYAAADRIEELEAQLREVEGTNWSLVQTINSLGNAKRERNADD